MNFINRYVMLYAALATIYAVVFYKCLNYLIESKQYSYIAILAIAYALIIFVSALYIGRKDIYTGYNGFNYHLLTYMMCNAVPIILASVDRIDKIFIDSTLQVMFFWGIGLLLHFVIHIMQRRKSIRGMDKDEVFR